MSVDEDVEEFRTNSLEAGRLQADGRIAAGNRLAGRSHAAYERLQSTAEGRQALRGLLADPADAIRIDVAGRLMPDPEARAALEGWAAAGGSLAESAAGVLDLSRMLEEEERR